jgi:SNF2 family DNA or RNA helicase
MKLFKHQEVALEQTKDFNRVAYYLDMGLGKTYVASEKMEKLNTPYNLLIVQKSKLQDWKEHFESYYPQYTTCIYSKTMEIPNNSVVIINYDLVWRRPELAALRNFTLILDESSCIKNATSNRTKFIMKLRPENVILLSGTPVGGKYEELLTQCKLLGWKITKKAFWDNYINYIEIDMGNFKIPKVVGYKNVDELKKKLSEYGAVFQKTEDVFDLPEQLENTVRVENTPSYKKFKKDRVITIDDKELLGDTSLTKMLYLRQLASQYNLNKLNALEDLLESTEDRVIIFYNFTAELEQIKKLCKELKKPISIISGKVKDLKNYEKCNNSITLVQYQAGAMGLNLQLSNKIIYYSLPLASELFEQSKKRTHRIGQNRSCFYWYLITKNSLEEEILNTLKLRKDYTDQLFKESES